MVYCKRAIVPDGHLSYYAYNFIIIQLLRIDLEKTCCSSPKQIYNKMFTLNQKRCDMKSDYELKAEIKVILMKIFEAFMNEPVNELKELKHVCKKIQLYCHYV